MTLSKKSYISALETVLEELDKERERWLRNEQAAKRRGRVPEHGDASNAVWDCVTRISEILDIANRENKTIHKQKLVEEANRKNKSEKV